MFSEICLNRHALEEKNLSVEMSTNKKLEVKRKIPTTKIAI